MQQATELKKQLQSIHRKSYPAYKSLKGSYQFGHYILSIDHVQGDPFASPSHISVKLSHRDTGFPAEYYKDSLTRITLGDFLNRQFEQQVNRYTFRAKGSGKSGLISVSHCGQEVLARTACEITEKGITARFFIGFPANGRTINSPELEKILFDFLPVCIHKAFFYRNLDPEALRKAICLAEDQAFIRQELKKRSLAAFVSDGAILPRESGISSRPMKNSVPFISPESLRVSMDLPHRGTITGMGIPCGITLIVGGGYHGKSTLLNALELGIYDHISGDGREYVITDPSAQKLRSEDGRFIKDVDISLFINDLPNGKDTVLFCTEDASGSTSQAANLIEAVEAGAGLLLLDEDTSATNFMIRDKVMARLVSDEKEPITTLLRHIRGIYRTLGISFVIVVGSSGDYLSVADFVLQMDHYKVKDVTKEAKSICEECGIAGQYPENEITVPAFSRKLKPVKPGRRKIKSMGTDTVLIDREAIDVRYLEQLSENGQTTALAHMMSWILDNVKAEEDIQHIIERMYTIIEKRGMEAIIPASCSGGHPVLPRKQELYACLSRYRSAKIVR